MIINNEAPMDNLQRIYSDNKRIEEGQQILNDILESWDSRSNIYILALDIDGSAEVRKHGIEAKINLVRQLQNRVNDILQDERALIDSGTRDEMFVIDISQDETEVINLAENIRSMVESEAFYLDLKENEKVNLTVSIGISKAPQYGKNSFDLLWSAKEALKTAKTQKNCIVTLDDIKSSPFHESFTQSQLEMLSLLGEYLGRDQESLIHEALSRLFDKHGGIWYWGVEQWDNYKQYKEE
ncbi:response regulator PleD [compost metagenome]